MEDSHIRETIRQSVNRITGIAPADIQDSPNYRQDLGLDSMTALETAMASAHLPAANNS